MKIKTILFIATMLATTALTAPTARLTEESVRELLALRDELVQRGDRDRVIQLFAPKARHTYSMGRHSPQSPPMGLLGYPGTFSRQGGEIVSMRSTLKEISVNPRGDETKVKTDILVVLQGPGAIKRLVESRFEENLAVVISDSEPRIQSSHLIILDDRVQSDERSERILSDVRAGRVNKEAALEELKKIGFRTSDENKKLSDGREPYGDEVPALISLIPEIRELELYRGMISDRGMEFIAKLKELELLSVQGSLITDKGIAQVAKLPNLTRLLIMIEPLTNDGLKALAGHGSLEHLDITSGQITGEGLSRLAKCPSLKSLSVAMVNLPDEGADKVGRLKNLKWLRLTHVTISDEGLRAIGRMEELEELRLNGMEVSDDVAERLSQLEGLRSLTLSSDKLTDEGLAHLAKLENLTYLALSGVQITDDGVVHLANLENLVNLRLSGPKITDKGLVHLKGLKKLNSLSLNGTMTPGGVAQAQRTNPGIRIWPESMANPCKDGLEKIYSAKDQWTKKTNAVKGSTPTPTDLAPYLRAQGGFAAFSCQHGGELSINPVGTRPSCSRHGTLQPGRAFFPFRGERIFRADDYDVEGAEPGRWTMDHEAALLQASARNLPILMFFTGSDWCGWSEMIVNTVFSTDQWKNYAEEHLVLDLIDFPKDKNLIPPTCVDRNWRLAENYWIDEIPRLILLQPDEATEIRRFGNRHPMLRVEFMNAVKTALGQEADSSPIIKADDQRSVIKPKELEDAGVHSTFKNDADGWTMVGGNPRWLKNSGGRICSEFPGGDGLTAYYVAPEKFRGDWTRYKTLQVELQSFGGDYYDKDFGMRGDVYIANGHLTATRKFGHRPPLGWETFRIPLKNEYWVLGGGAIELEDVLRDVSDFHIRAEYGVGHDHSYLDNVLLLKSERHEATTGEES